MGGTFLQAHVRCCLWLTSGNLFGATSDTHFVTAPAEFGCLLERPSSESTLDPGSGPQKSQGAPMRSAFGCQLPGGLSHWKTIWLYYSAVHKLHKVWWEGIQRVGLLLSTWLMLYRGKCSTQARLHLQFGRMSQCRDPDDWLFSCLPEPQTQNFPHTTLVCSTFLLLDPRLSGYKLNFECWPFKREPVSLANCCFLLTDRMLSF